MEWADEPYEGIEFVDERIARVPQRGGELPGGPAQGDGSGEHGPEREERDGREGPRLVPALPEQSRFARRDGDRDLGRRCRRGGVEAVVVIDDGLHSSGDAVGVASGSGEKSGLWTVVWPVACGVSK